MENTNIQLMRKRGKRPPLRREIGERDLFQANTQGVSRPGAHMLRKQQQQRKLQRQYFQSLPVPSDAQPVDITKIEAILRECIYEFGTDPEEGYLGAATKILKNPVGRYTRERKEKLLSLAARCDKVNFSPGKIGGRRKKQRRTRRWKHPDRNSFTKTLKRSTTRSRVYKNRHKKRHTRRRRHTRRSRRRRHSKRR